MFMMCLRRLLPSRLVVLVMAAPPHPFPLVAPPGRALEPLIQTPEAVQSTRIGGIRVIDDSILEHKRTHARPLTNIRGHVGSCQEGVVGDGVPRHTVRHSSVITHVPRGFAPV